jgi:hypothetical protein
VETTFALKVAELISNACKGFLNPIAKLLIVTPESVIKASGGIRTDLTFRSTHSLLIMVSEVKPNKMLDIDNNPAVNSKGTLCLMKHA